MKRARGKASRVQFARKLELSYTFVRAMEHGLRFPSDKVLLDIAECLGEDPGDLFLAAYCDRSTHLAGVLTSLGVKIPEGGEVSAEPGIASEATIEPTQPEGQIDETFTPPTRAVRAHDPF
ncbi:MAG: transcriptional regulator with XRE-family HTH domain [Planctomycetota bacterium]